MLRKREVLRRGVARVCLGAAAHFGLDVRNLGVSYGFALRTTFAAFLMLERIAVWALFRVYEVAAWTVRLIVAVLDWMGATY